MRKPLIRKLPFALPLLATAAGALLWAPSASAIDSERKRIRVDFGEVACIQRVVRSENAVHEFNWSIEEEEVYPIPADEVDGGRRHQILAIRKQSVLELPTWLSQTDIDATAAKIDGFGAVEDAYIWESSPDWPADVWRRVTPDAPRIEITNAAAEAGASFDTTGLAPGPYQLIGYTYDPPVNVTSRADGLLKVVDSPNEDGAPALYVHAGDFTVVTEGDRIDFDACLDAAPGTTLEAYLGEVQLGVEPEWEAIPLQLGDVPNRGEFQLSVDIPYGWGGQPLRKVLLRVDAVDPDGARYTAYASRFFEVAADPNGGEESGETGGENESSGGGCDVGGRSGALGLLGLVLGLSFRRRRRAR